MRPGFSKEESEHVSRGVSGAHHLLHHAALVQEQSWQGMKKRLPALAMLPTDNSRNATQSEFNPLYYSNLWGFLKCKFNQNNQNLIN